MAVWANGGRRFRRGRSDGGGGPATVEAERGIERQGEGEVSWWWLRWAPVLGGGDCRRPVVVSGWLPWMEARVCKRGREEDE